MVREVLASDRTGELGQHPSQSRNGDRRRGCRDLGGGGRERRAAYLRWLARCSCPAGPASRFTCRLCPDRRDERRDSLKDSCGLPRHGDQLHVGRCEAVPYRHSALAVAAGVEVALALALAFVLCQALEIALAVAVAVAFALPVGLVIPVANGLIPMGLR
jgi:hypothetical protein